MKVCVKILKWRDPKGEWLSYVLVGDYDACQAQEVVAGLHGRCTLFFCAESMPQIKKQMKTPDPGA